MNLVVDVAVGLVIDTVRWDGMCGEDESHQPKCTSQVDQIESIYIIILLLHGNKCEKVNSR